MEWARIKDDAYRVMFRPARPVAALRAKSAVPDCILLFLRAKQTACRGGRGDSNRNVFSLWRRNRE